MSTWVLFALHFAACVVLQVHVGMAAIVQQTLSAGELPAELSGTLLRNGPGLLEIGGKPLTQPLDGDGMVGISNSSLLH